MPCRRNVIESCNSNFSRNANPGFPERTKSSDGHCIICCKNRAGTQSPVCHEFAPRFVTRILCKIALNLQSGIQGDSSFSQRSAISASSLLTVDVMLCPGDDGDALVTMVDQMPHHLLRAALVRDPDRCDPR